MNLKSTIQIISLAAIIFEIPGCSSKLLIKEDPSVKEIAVCTQMGPLIVDSLKMSIDSITNKFIEDYNSENRFYRLIQCQNDSLRTLYLDVLRITITDPANQVGGVVLTAIGAVVPFVMLAMNSPFCVWFAYLPRSSIQVNIKLSNDISEAQKQRPRHTYAGSGKYFGSYENQKHLLFNGYYDRLRLEMKNIENRYNENKYKE